MMAPLMYPPSHPFHQTVQNSSYFTFFSELQQSHWMMTVIETLVLLTVFVVAFISNIGAFLLVTQERRMTNNTVFTLNLFLADLLFVSTAPLVITVRWTRTWRLGSVACHIVMYSIAMCGAVTITTLAAISIERMVAVLKMETTPSLNPKWAFGGLLVIWLFSAIVLFPLSLFSRVVPVISHQQEEMHVCTLIWPHLMGEVVWNGIFIVLGFLFPAASIVISYSKIIQVRKRSKRRLHSTTSSAHVQSSAVSKQDYKLYRTLLILIISFFITWTPVFTFTFLIFMHNIKINLNITSSMFFWVVTFTMVNSALNPVLYSLYQLKHSLHWSCCAMEVTPGQSAGAHR